ncbi:hypothetical protein DXG03_004298 [Asterophora parasitica]|uniref:Uncharacterized protein n=1 Tax=Asterophora parasitica TaxID=117018 RepID=A0A9P7KAB1_9AGAR|nr:hypothetical protein DXG03_004298 [Asterophora parasitica]
MPWHDVHMTLVGPVVLDIVQHFVERWNEIKKRKVRFIWLDLPHDTDAAPNEAVALHPHRDHWREIGHKYRQRWLGVTAGADRDLGYHQPQPKNCRVQVVRSVADWSHGVLKEHSIQNACEFPNFFLSFFDPSKRALRSTRNADVELIREAKHFIYIGLFIISATKPGHQVKNLIAEALVERIVIVCIPELPGFAGDFKDEGSLKTIMAAQYRTINRGGASIYEEIRKAGYEPYDHIRFFHLRAYDRINAPMASFISKMEKKSGVTFHEAQVALSRQWIGHEPESTQEVTLTIPGPTTEGIVVSDKTPRKTETVPIPESAEAARAIVERFEQGAAGLRGDEEVSETVAQHMLNDRTGLMAEKWLGTPEEELNACVYVLSCLALLFVHADPEAS